MTKHARPILQLITSRLERLSDSVATSLSRGVMRRRYFMSLLVVGAFSLVDAALSSGMMRRWRPMNIPSKLPTPKTAQWRRDLEKVMELEIFSRDQYEADATKYRAHMPYMRVIPDERNHVHWIGRLFSAYDLRPNLKTMPLEQTADLGDAYSLCLQLEENLIPRYETLIAAAEDDTTASVLDRILWETRMHYTMFSHALRMGGMMGRGMGRGGGRGYCGRGR